MIRRLLIPLLGSGLLLAATAGSALAKCEGTDPKPEFCSQLIVDLRASDGGIFQAGTSEAVTVQLSRGEQPFEALGVNLTFTSGDGTTVRESAIATSRAGIWEAEVLLPVGGRWEAFAQVVTADGSAIDVGLQAIQVPRVELPPASTPVTPPPATPTSPILPIGLGVAALGAAALLAQGIRERSKRRQATGVAAAVGSPATADRS